MTLGTALFASVVLILAVFHKPFRKIAIVAGILVGVFYGGRYAYDKHKERVYYQREVACKVGLGLDDHFHTWTMDDNNAYFNCMDHPEEPVAKFKSIPQPGFTPVDPPSKRIQ